MNVFRMAIMSFFFGIAGLLCLVVGFFPAIIRIDSAFAARYLGALNKKEAKAQPVAEPPAETPPVVQP